MFIFTHIYIYRQYIVLSYFIWSDHLVFLFGVLKLFTFNVVVDIIEIKCTCLLFVISFFVPILIFKFILLFYFKYSIGLLII